VTLRGVEGRGEAVAMARDRSEPELGVELERGLVEPRRRQDEPRRELDDEGRDQERDEERDRTCELQGIKPS